MVSGFMEAVASDLEIDLTVHTDLRKNRFSYRELLENVLDQQERPDYIVFMCKEKVTHEMLTMIGEAGIKAFSFNTDVPEDEIGETGRPREYLDHWIGHVSPDNQSAGRVLAEELRQRFEKVRGSKAEMLVALTGSRDSSAAVHRDQGLARFLDEQPSISHQLLFTNWDQYGAAAKVEVLIDRYQGLDLVWSASDGMALGAISAAQAKGRKPGRDIMIGGFDWEDRALEAISEGQMEVSLGRHFMGGGLALLLIRDYHAGHDFADAGEVSMQYSFTIADRENLQGVRQVMARENWQEVDFRQFSKHYNDDRRGMPVTASGLLDEFMGELSPEFR
jgi:ABC-type sugar transport system substrate-binding protein